MTEEHGSPHCRKEACTAASTGVCANGHANITECEYWHSGTEDTESVYEEEFEDVISSALGEGDNVQLPSGEALDEHGVEEFLRWRPVKFITIAGERNSGKTTLLWAIYDRFLQGPFAGCNFAGSRTLIGLERRSHYSRVDSGLMSPDTPHTSLAEGLKFLHFSLAPRECADTRYDLMLSDRAGEFYRHACDMPAMVGDLIEVTKADCFMLLVDGGRVVDPEERAGVLHEARQLLRALLEGGALDAQSTVQIVISKADLIRALPDPDPVKHFVDKYCRQLEDFFAPKLKSLEFFEIAARPQKNVLPLAWGVENLVQSWLATPSRPGEEKIRAPLLLHSEFDKLLARTPGLELS